MDVALRILHLVAQSVGRALDVDDILQAALDVLSQITPHDVATLHLLSDDGTVLRLRAQRGLSPEVAALGAEVSADATLLGRVARSGETVQLSGDGALFARGADGAPDVLAVVSLPVPGRERVLGALSLGRRKPEPFAARDVALLDATAAQIGIALDNARLFFETRRQLEELRRVQGQLVHAGKLSGIGDLAAGVAHEINNPLTTILGQAHLLLTSPGISDSLQARLRMIADEAARAGTIVHNLLVFARHYPPERRPCSLAEPIERVLALKSYRLERDGIRIVREFGACPPVWADEHQLQHVMLALIQNAHEAMLGGSGERMLTLRVGAVGDRARVEVIDTGPGIPADVLPRIFDPFFSTKGPAEGTGLGLSISWGIVAEHGGRLSAANRPEGGAAFTMELPIDNPAARAAAPA